MRVSKKKSRGNIAAVLLTVLVGLSLLFTVAAGAVSQLHLTSHSTNAQQARNFAEAAIQTTIAHLRQDLRFGQTSSLMPTSPAAEVRVEHGPAVGLLSFHAGRAADLEIPVSFNNVESDATAQGWNERVVPPEGVQLVAVGTCGGVIRTVEEVLHVPRFPYVVSNSGVFESDGPLAVGVLPDLADPATISLDDLLPGHLASNSSVQVQGAAVVSGDVEAVHDISLVSPARVRGRVRPNSSPVPLVKMRVTDYEPNPSITEVFSGSSETAQLSGFYQGSGEVNVNGGLDLQGGVLYVDGNLHVTGGGVTGKGAIISTGTITVEGTTDLVGDQQVALLSHGDVTLNGNGAFRGVVYTEGDLHSQGVRLVGALVANSSNGGAIKLQDSGAVVGEPSMKFDEGWLYDDWNDQVSIPWHPALGNREMAQVRRQGHATHEGNQFVMDWTFEWVNPTVTVPWDPASHNGAPAPDPEGYLNSLGPLPSVREVYDNQGHRISSNYDELYGPFMQRCQAEFEARLNARLDELNDNRVRDHRDVVEGREFTPPMLTPKRVLADPVLQTFKVDFNQFLRPEENLRLLLRADH